MKDLLEDRTNNLYLLVSAYFPRSLQGFIYHYLSQYKGFRERKWAELFAISSSRFYYHEPCVWNISFFPNYKVLSRTEILVFLRSTAGFLLENCNLILSLINNIPLSKILWDLYYSSIFDGVILASGSALRHVFYSGTCIPQVSKFIFSHVIFFCSCGNYPMCPAYFMIPRLHTVG